MEEYRVVRLGADGTLDFGSMPCKPQLEVISGKCSENRGRMYKGCRITGVIEPTYNIVERFVRWVGRKLSIEFLCYFHQKSALYEVSFESVEEWMGE